MDEDKIKEIRELKEIEKHLPTIIYQKIKQKTYSEGYENEFISVSDKTSEDALKVFKQIREEIKK